jgi:hypothetical protein
MMRLTLLALAVVATSLSARAWLRPSYEDATVAERSELIVVARLKESSINKVPHDKPLGEGESWEYHATLIISKVVKGTCEKKEIPVIIHYGLTPVVSVEDKGVPMGHVKILDTGNSDRGHESLIQDAAVNNLWFLRKRSGTFGREPGIGEYGIVDPEDVQPLTLKPYFLLYLSADPGEAVKEYAKKNPKQAERAKRYLDHLEVQRALKLKDPQRRYESLLPYFQARMTWDMKEEARDGIVSCGATAGERLKKVFANPTRPQLRDQIIGMWKDMGYREIAPYMIELLTRHERYWAAQNPKKDWWTDDTDPDYGRRREIYGEVYAMVVALRSFRDPQAKEVLEATRTRWLAIDFENRQIVEECTSALKELGANK